MRSSRAIERRCHDGVAFRVITAQRRERGRPAVRLPKTIATTPATHSVTVTTPAAHPSRASCMIRVRRRPMVIEPVTGAEVRADFEPRHPELVWRQLSAAMLPPTDRWMIPGVSRSVDCIACTFGLASPQPYSGAAKWERWPGWDGPAPSKDTTKGRRPAVIGVRRKGHAPIHAVMADANDCRRWRCARDRRQSRRCPASVRPAPRANKALEIR
jgi:hypothetical protein